MLHSSSVSIVVVGVSTDTQKGADRQQVCHVGAVQVCALRHNVHVLPLRLLACLSACLFRYELSADEVRRKLSAQTTKQQQQRQPRHSATALKKHSPAGKSTRSSSPGQLQQSYSGDQPLAGNPQLPPGMQFVTVSWLTQSLKSRRRCDGWKRIMHGRGGVAAT